MLQAFRRWVFAATVALTAAACDDPGKIPSGPTPAAPRPMVYEDGSGVIYDGWDGWLQADGVQTADGELVQCPTNIWGIGPVPYGNRTWTSDNGPYVAYIQRADRTFYRRQDGNKIDFVALQDDA